MSGRGLSRHLTKDLDPKAVSEVWERIEAKRRRGRRPTWAWASASALALLVLVLLVLHGVPFDRGTSEARLASGAPLPAVVVGTVDLDDGSRVIVPNGASLVTGVNTADAISFQQAGGTVTFDVRPHGPRAWTVDAGIALVHVIGTRFLVSREPHRVRVEVERGIVLVTSEHLGNGGRTLTAGESVDVSDGAESAGAPSGSALLGSPLPPVLAASVDELPPAPVTPATPATPASAERRDPPAPALQQPASWRPLVDKGDYRAAYDALGHENVEAETKRATSAEELLQIADVARLSGHPRDAVAPLEGLVAAHPTDPRASTAAFTLGKIQLDALGAPDAAAGAFEKAIALGLPSAIREDAFARRVEAYAAAGDRAKATNARTAYDVAFPTGRQREAVARWAP